MDNAAIRAHAEAVNAEIIKAHKDLNDHWDVTVKAHPGEPMTAEEAAQEARIQARIDELSAERDRVIKAETRQQESETLRDAHAAVFGDPQKSQPGKPGTTEYEQADAFFRGRGPGNGVDEAGKPGFHVDLSRGKRVVDAMRSGADSRDLRNVIYTHLDSGSLLVPTDLSSQIYAFMTESVAMIGMDTTKITTTSGNPIDFPRVSTHGVGTMVGEGTAIGGTDPVFAKMTLNAYKYGELVQLSYETLQDDGVDIVGFIAQNIGRAVGEVVATDLVAGSGSSKPNGIMTAITNAAVNGGTVHGVVAGVTYEDLVTCAYRVNGSYRARSSAAWLMKDTTAGSLRKLRDGAGGTVGAVLWNPSLTEGIQGAEPGRLLGHPVWTDPNVASVASTNKVIAFGDWSAYYIRLAGGFRFERSDDYAFNTDLSTFRGLTRVDGDVIDIGRAFNGIRVL